MIKHEDNLKYWRKYNKRNKEPRREYRQQNKQEKKEYLAGYYEEVKKEKRFYYKTCDLACTSNYALKKHLGTLKHSCAWLNAVD